MIIKESRMRDILRLFIWHPFRWFCRSAPLWINYRLFHLMGLLHFALAKGKKNELRKIMAEVLSVPPEDKKIKFWIRDYFSNHYTDRMSVFHYNRLNKKNLPKIISFEGLDILEKALSKKRGCVLIHSHLGPSQLPLVALGKMGYSMTQLGFRSDADLSSTGKNLQLRIRLQIEERFPAHMLYVDNFTRPIFKNLAGNGVVMTACDGLGTGQYFGPTVSMPFLGKKMFFASGPYKLADITGATPLFLFLKRKGRFHYRAIITKPYNSAGEKNSELLLESFVFRLEEFIRSDPGQWQFWDGLKPGLLLE